MSYAKQFKYVFNLQFIRCGGTLTFFMLIHILFALGIAIGFTYLYADIDQSSILFLATGAPTMILIMIGLVSLPVQNSNAKVEGYIDFLRTLPVRRSVIILVDTLIWLCVTLPGIIISTVCSHFIFHPGYAISWTIIPGFILTALTCIGVGYGFSYAFPPQVAMSLSQVIAFGSLMFSPINFPIDRLPGWLQAVHHVLPIYSMAEVLRSSMACTTFSVSSVHYIRLIIWCVIGYGGAIYVLNKK